MLRFADSRRLQEDAIAIYRKKHGLLAYSGAPTDEDVARVVAAVFHRVERVLADREPDAAQRRFMPSAVSPIARQCSRRDIPTSVPACKSTCAL